MSAHTGPIKRAWNSNSGRRAMWATIVASFILTVILGSVVRENENTIRQDTIEKTIRTLASTVLSAGGENDDILLKVNDLLNVEGVLGVRLQTAQDIPLSVGEIEAYFFEASSAQAFLSQWDSEEKYLEAALKLDPTLPYDWLLLRLDRTSLMPPPILGTFINWIAAPFIGFLNGVLCLWVMGSFFYRPLATVQDFLQESSGHYASSKLPQGLIERSDEFGLLAKQIEAMRQEINEAKTKADFQARFLHETPYPLIRCSVNRKVLYANVSARSENALFGDDTKEFVSPALSELVRKAFYETKEVYGDIRCPNHLMTFRAIPVLDAGYVNLYGEIHRKSNELL